MMGTIIIAKNQTAWPLALDQISIPNNEIPAYGQATLTDYASVSEIYEDSTISAYIESGEVIINDGVSDLTAEQSLNYTSPVISRNNIDEVIKKNNFSSSINPTPNSDRSEGYGIGSTWINASTNEVFVCTNPLQGSASWSSTTGQISQSKKLSDFISGPTEGFLSGSFREIIGGFFPTSITWFTDDTKTKKIVEKIITRTGGTATKINPTPIIWNLFSDDGITVIATITDTITGSPFEMYRERTHS